MNNAPDIIWEINDCDTYTADTLAFKMGVSRSVAEVFIKRGLDTPEKVEEFSNLCPSKLHDPMLLPDIEPVVERVEYAIDHGERIFVHGDYDVDGVTSTAVVVKTLRRLGADFNYHVPHRITDGYDIKEPSVDRAKNAGASLLMSVDCGIVAFKAAEHAKKLGLDLIITDHHHPADDGSLPYAVGVINPNRHDSTYPFDGLAGVGIAFKTMMALCRSRGVDEDEIMAELLEFVALGTVADVAPMIDENRVLVSLGCERLQNTTKIGLRKLLDVAGVKTVNTTSIGFGLGPRINAVGRLADSATALELMLERSEYKAKTLADQLNIQNATRQKQQEKVVKEAMAMLPEDMSDINVIVLWAKGWHKGLVGLVAGKLAEAYGRPALVCTVSDDGATATGSCRSTRKFDILKALKSEGCWELFEKCGGHAFAAGFTLPASNLPLLSERLNAYASKMSGHGVGARILEIDACLQPSDVNEATFNELARLAPFGSHNHQPIFMVRNMEIAKASQMGADGIHLKLRLKAGTYGSYVDAVGWRMGHHFNECPEGSRIDAVFKLGMDEFRGRSSLTMTLEDFKRSG